MLDLGWKVVSHLPKIGMIDTAEDFVLALWPNIVLVGRFLSLNLGT